MAHKIFADYAVKSILYEVSTSPKPGLVDRISNGAHHDMDFFTFMASSSAISSGFYEISDLSHRYVGKPSDLLGLLRPIGIQMEEKMFAATGGINTHKGIIFSLGILVAASVQMHKTNTLSVEHIIDYVKTMTVGLTTELTGQLDGNQTSGERNFKIYGKTGIRGEVEDGFPTVLKSGLDALRNSYYTLQCKNDLFIQTLFSLMTCCDDSNIISRHNPETLQEVQVLAKNFLESGGMSQDNAHLKLEEMDQDFIDQHISPGGSADLLAVTIFFGLIENIIE